MSPAVFAARAVSIPEPERGRIDGEGAVALLPSAGRIHTYASSDVGGWDKIRRLGRLPPIATPADADAHGIYTWYLDAQDPLRQILFRGVIGSQERTERVPSVFCFALAVARRRARRAEGNPKQTARPRALVCERCGSDTRETSSGNAPTQVGVGVPAKA